MRLIDLEELERSLDDSKYVDPYEIPGFLEHCKKECQVIDAIPIEFIKIFTAHYGLMYGQYKDAYAALIEEWRKYNGQQ